MWWRQLAHLPLIHIPVSYLFEITNPGEDSCLRINDRWETTANQALNQSSLSDSVWQAQRRQASTRVWKLPRSFQLSSGLLFPQKTTGRTVLSSRSPATPVMAWSSRPSQSSGHLPPPFSLSLWNNQGKNLLTVLPQTTWPASSGDGDLLKLHGLLPCYPCAWTDRWSCPWTLLAVSSQDCPVLASSVQSY